MATYRIIRMYQGNTPNRTIERGLSLAEAQAHCSDPETSSRTATSATAKARTRRYGAWFDGYEEEPAKRSRRRHFGNAKAWLL